MYSPSLPQVRHAAIVVTATLLSLSVGACLQLETLIEVHPDQSATVTERLRLSQQLLDQGAKEDVAQFLSKEAALNRMKQMGKGMTLVSHTVRDAEQGSRESVAVFKIPNISDFTYVSPYLAVANYPKHHAIKCTMFPVYESTWWGRHAGQMGVSFTSVTSEPERGGTPPAPPPPPSPASLQALRDIQPIFRDLLKDFKLKVTFKGYTPLRFRQYYRYRGMRERTTTYDLIDFSDKNLDNYGTDFLSNEEVMLELLKMNFGGPNITEQTKAHADNPTLPVFQFRSTPEIYLPPSRQMFDQHFAGKTLTHSREQNITGPAKFEEIGFKGETTTKPAEK